MVNTIQSQVTLSSLIKGTNMNRRKTAQILNLAVLGTAAYFASTGATADALLGVIVYLTITQSEAILSD